MTDVEWDKFVVELVATFRGDLAIDRERALRRHFGRVSYGNAIKVIDRLVLKGQVFLPSPAELVGTLREVVGRGWTFDCAINGQTSAERREVLMAEQARRRRAALPSVTQ